ncbi:MULTISPECIES: DUF305 domain-containing protein [unclassified Devosia]|uniref:DUF305 domain-containing protein n=1 Tax=unclassified Devosia TaxID=196773 RepID=UPI0025BE256D|nr:MULTISPECIES: DUF305 domain-containing protein [unclassified Devosia]
MQGAHQRSHGHPYLWLAANLVLSLAAMYVLMFTMIDSWGDFRNNINMLYMSLTMLCPMGVIMLLTMRGMYSNRRANIALYAGFVFVFIASLAGIRTQTPVGDMQFIASMIPHHSGAILMCREAQIHDSELKSLCAEISAGQRREIDQMNAIASRLSGKQ